MFRQLLNLFRNKDSLELSIDELEQWLKAKNSKLIASLQSICKEFVYSLNEELSELKEGMAELENAEIKDKDKIEQRVITIVLSNRKSFIEQSNHLISRIVPNYEDIAKTIEFSDKLKAELDTFAQATYKNFYASQHLFYKEVEAIKKIISKISKLNDLFSKKIAESGYAQIDKIAEKLSLLKAGRDNKAMLAKNLEEQKANFDALKKEKEQNAEKIKHLEKSPDYRKYLEDTEKLASQQELIKRHELKLVHNFAVIDSALKKYTKIADEEFRLIHEYETDAFAALLKDRELKIIESLQKITQKILKNELLLKESKKDKILAEIKSINRQYLGELIDDYRKLDIVRREIKKKVDDNQVAHELDACRLKDAETEKRIIATEKDINSAIKSTGNADDSKLTEEIKAIFSEAFDVELKIKSSF